MERFDNMSKTTPPTSADDTPNHANTHTAGNIKHEVTHGKKRQSPDSGASANESEAGASPAKRRKQPDGDARLAAKLQAEENSRARPSRNGISKKATVARKKATPKKKSTAKIKADDDDGDVELKSDGEKKDVVRKGGFHVG